MANRRICDLKKYTDGQFAQTEKRPSNGRIQENTPWYLTPPPLPGVPTIFVPCRYFFWISTTRRWLITWNRRDGFTVWMSGTQQSYKRLARIMDRLTIVGVEVYKWSWISTPDNSCSSYVTSNVKVEVTPKNDLLNSIELIESNNWHLWNGRTLVRVVKT